MAPCKAAVSASRQSSVDLADAMNGGKIVLANLSQGKLGEDNAALLGAILITQIQLAAMARVHAPESQRRDFYLYADEFQNFATESFTKILAEARKYRLNLILANQYVAQMPESVQKAIFGNCGTVMCLTVGAEDAVTLSREFNHTYSPADLTTLGRYQLVNRLTIANSAHQPFPAQAVALPAAARPDRAKVVRVSRERYGRLRERVT
ncbi:MAG: TraM recognition domain-containing protein [Caldilineales bacterium]|nr:TraM recognition domain-containing protein [Caldilineales bacterium]